MDINPFRIAYAPHTQYVFLLTDFFAGCTGHVRRMPTKRGNAMKLAYISHDELPSPSTATEQMVNNLYELSKHVRVDLILAQKRGEEHSTRKRVEEVRSFYGLENAFPPGLKFIDVRLSKTLSGKARMGMSSMKASRFVRKRPYDAVYVRGEFPLIAATRTGLPTVFETYRVDINTDTLHEPWRKFCYKGENPVAVITHSQLCRQSFLDLGFAPERVLVAHNGFSPSVMEPRLTKEEARDALGLEQDKRYVIYTGAVNAAKGLDVILDIAARLKDVTFLVVGAEPGSEGEEWFRNACIAARLPNVVSIPRVPPAEIPTYLYAADCLLIPPTGGPLKQSGRTVLPIKTFIYMAAGRPIVAGNLPDTREVLAHDRNALLVSPDDAPAATEAIQRVLTVPDQAALLAGNAVADSHKLTWESRAVRIAEFLKERIPTA